MDDKERARALEATLEQIEAVRQRVHPAPGVDGRYRSGGRDFVGRVFQPEFTPAR